ncbi:transcriptional regulator [Aeromonas caviae]|uniref:winged helix-turn-helix domain-containing protein n=1 Tax=Aeromonas caviae TaxID=648 RepID=UPI002B467D1F|nr:winged helix-turn-helix domain-containing protein [Aeromonas caviae]
MNQHYIINNNINFESKRYRLVINNKEITLSQKETELLEVLCISSLAVVERNHLLQSIWGSSESADIGLNKNILMLRRKFESIGIHNAIKTIPRIGYMLALEVKTIKSDEEKQHDISTDEPEPLAQPQLEEGLARVNTASSEKTAILSHRNLRKKKSLFVILFLFCLTALYLIIRHDSAGVKNTPLLGFDRYNNPALSLFIKKGLTVNKQKTVKAIQVVLKSSTLNEKYYILATERNISIASVSDNGSRRQANFILDKANTDLNTELPCAMSQFIKHHKINNILNDPLASKSISMRFFIGCHTDDFLADLHIVRIGHPEKITTVLHRITATDSHHRPLFHFDRTSDYESSLGKDGTRQVIFHNSPSPLEVDDLALIGENEQLIKLIDEFTSAKTTHVLIDQQSNIFMSDIMGGVLYVAS